MGLILSVLTSQQGSVCLHPSISSPMYAHVLTCKVPQLTAHNTLQYPNTEYLPNEGISTWTFACKTTDRESLNKFPTKDESSSSCLLKEEHASEVLVGATYLYEHRSRLRVNFLSTIISLYGVDVSGAWQFPNIRSRGH